MVKQCSKCKKVLSFDNFNKKSSGKYGIEAICKTCRSEYSRAYRARPEVKKLLAEHHKGYRSGYIKTFKGKAARWRWHRSDRVKRRNLGTDMFYVSDKDIKRLMRSSCFNCNSNERLEVDHVIPLTLGGRHSIGNLQVLCHYCNRAKFNKLPIQFRVQAGSEA